MRLYFSGRDAWRGWLAKHSDRKRVVWLVFYKKHTGKPGPSVNEAVEEALCFGWIDSLVKRLDEDRFLVKFTPRTDTGRWSAINIERMRRLIKTGRMTDAGLRKMDRGVHPTGPPARLSFRMPPAFARALRANPKARQNFSTMAPSYRRHFVGWIAMAKREDTRERRLREAISLLEHNRTLGLK